MLPLAREAGERGGTIRARTTPRTNWPSARSSTAASASSTLHPSSRRPSAASTAHLHAISTSCAKRTGRRVGWWEPHGRDRAIVGLALLVMIHEAGHFFASRAVGMNAAQVLHRLRPAIFKTTRGGVEYGIGSIPLGGYVKIPGMSRPSPGDLRKLLPPAEAEQYESELRAIDEAIERGDYDTATTSRCSCNQRWARRARGRSSKVLSPVTRTGARRPGAPRRDLRRAGRQPRVAILLFTALFLISVTRDTNIIARVPRAPGGGRARAGGRQGDRGRRRQGPTKGHPGAHPRDPRAAVHARARAPRPARRGPDSR